MIHSLQKKHWLFGLVLLLGFAAAAGADVRLPSLVGDNMVLQKGEKANVWGWASPGEPVIVEGSWGSKSRTTADRRDGRWSVDLSLPEAGGPYSITIRGDNLIKIENVLVGEVWVCSGQSNMEMGITACNNAEEEVAGADHPEIRLFQVERSVSAIPLDKLKHPVEWKVCSTETVAQEGWGGFSAAAYYFGRTLHNELKVPIGLIHTSWGGTPAESWTSADMLARVGGYENQLEDLDFLAVNTGKVDEINRQKIEEWEKALEAADAGYGQDKWYASGFDDSQWKTMDLPGSWNDNELKSFDGVAWFRKSIDLPESWAGKELLLELGPIDDEDRTWVNGTSVGQTQGWTAKRKYKVPARAVESGRALIVVRVLDTGGGGGIYGDKKEIKILPVNAPEDTISLAGPWRYMASSSAAKLPPRPRMLAVGAHTVSSLYNAMISPLLPYRIKGAIWYQGESNCSRSRSYEALFESMIDCWREGWGVRALPFYYVQIAPFLYAQGGDCAGVREAQRRVMNLENTGMAVTSDIGNILDIHPRNKQDVGKRLALWALKNTYGKEVGECSGPIFKGIKAEGNKARLFFDHCESGLAVREGHTLSSFKLAGSDGIFLPAEAAIDGKCVILSCPLISNPVGVCYAWSNTAEGNLINKEGLPASCFNSLWNFEDENPNTALIPVPLRGWWWNRHNDKLELIEKGGVDLVFIGDSITHSWENQPQHKIWEKYYGHRNPINLGFSGDRTENVLWRLDNGEIDNISPKVAVVMIGTNNTDAGHFPKADSAQEVAEGIIAICKTLRIKLPKTKVLMLCPFPYGQTPNPRRAANQEAGTIASKIADNEHIFYLDIGDEFLDPDKTLEADIMPDFLHPNETGYRIWARAMEPVLSRLMEDKPVK